MPRTDRGDRIGHRGPGAPILWVAVAILAACAPRSYVPAPLSSVDLVDRARAQEADGVRVRASVPSREEAKALLGFDVYARDIQPIWIEVRNDTGSQLRFAPVSVDREYYATREVAYIHKSRYAGKGYEAMERYVAESAMPRWIGPGRTRSGFVYTHRETGTKAFNVDLFMIDGGHRTFSFFIDVPGFEPDHARIDFDALYDPSEMMDADATGLRDAVAGLECCTTDVTGEAASLPINVVFVADGEDLLESLLRAGFKERPRAAGVEQIETAPHWQGRPADAVFRSSRSGRSERNELRVWRAPLDVDGEETWVGQITQYIGRPTAFERAFFDPLLDPNIDEATSWLLQRMWYAQALRRFSWLSTAEVVSLQSPRTDFRGVSYFTNGTRVVLWLSGEPISQAETQYVEWDPEPYRRTP